MAAEKYNLDGIVVSLNTPFNEEGRVDFASLERLVEMHRNEGAVGFLTTAQAAEVYELTLAERIDIVRCVKGVAGHAQVIAGATAREEGESFALAEAATGAGCEGVLVEIPTEIKADRSAISEFLQSFVSIGMPMLMIQDLDWVGQGLDVDFIAELFERLEPFKCLKVEVTPSGPKYSAVLAATGGRLHVSGGWASQQMIEALDRGVSAFIPTAMTGLFSAVMSRYRAGDREGAKAVFHSLLPVLAFTRQHLDVSIHFHKKLFHSRGLFRTAAVRKRSGNFDAYHEKYADELIRYLDRAEGELVAHPQTG
jgi:dihydrodipicolinate synthase/N-acetylneuraminate lyase